MARARGANAIMALEFNGGAYGAIPTGNWHKMPFVSSNLGEEQALIESDLLGYGRAPQPPSKDVINDDGDVQVPVDLRNFGYWLKLLLGVPATAAGVAASGAYVFSAQPANNAIITVGGQAFTFVTGTPAANQIKIGATLADTLFNAVLALNASVVAGVAVASYSLDLAGTTITITHDTLGTGGNAFTIVAGSSPATNATPSGATLAGGSASGPFNNVYEAGALTLPDACIEIGLPDVPSYGVNFGCLANTLAIEVQRSGHLSAAIGLICQGETRLPTSSAGTPTEQVIERFSQFTSQIERAGTLLGDIVSGGLNFSNGLDKVEVVRQDGRIAGADPGMMSATGNVVVRFKDNVMFDLAIAGEPIDLAFGWRISASKRLRIVLHSVFLPKPRLPLSGPGGVQATFAYQSSAQSGTSLFLTATLVNDIDHSA
ncbi:phage tail tube protein [Phenylobacterium sp.]|uniref:phage tail tube protein n=1 Tax=Phenylobacterium sp. TaxID=1871053 RepID=UPI002733C63B|nr:phage tail tube protein [Phenylobacterium sp.]MDP3853153.1 phage tail tube protein [Phenylobacterium sp.]